MLVIIDNNMGNVQSVANALGQLDIKCIISNEPKVIKQSTAIIFPGVGAFPMAMNNLKVSSLIEIIIECIVERKTPFLGICLGMQLLFKESPEQKVTKGLGLIKGRIKRINSVSGITVPHVGWNDVVINKDNPLFKNIDSKAKFYYDHSYFAMKTNEDCIATLNYGEEMSVGVWKGNIFGVQFHPEKSQRNGLKLLRNYIDYADQVSPC